MLTHLNACEHELFNLLRRDLNADLAANVVGSLEADLSSEWIDDFLRPLRLGTFQAEYWYNGIGEVIRGILELADGAAHRQLKLFAVYSLLRAYATDHPDRLNAFEFNPRLGELVRNAIDISCEYSLAAL